MFYWIRVERRKFRNELKSIRSELATVAANTQEIDSDPILPINIDDSKHWVKSADKFSQTGNEDVRIIDAMEDVRAEGATQHVLESMEIINVKANDKTDVLNDGDNNEAHALPHEQQRDGRVCAIGNRNTARNISDEENILNQMVNEVHDYLGPLVPGRHTCRNREVPLVWYELTHDQHLDIAKRIKEGIEKSASMVAAKRLFRNHRHDKMYIALLAKLREKHRWF